MLCIQSTVFTQARSVIDFDYNWKFSLINDSLASRANYDDSKWRTVSLPHDWSIESNFSNAYPATNQGGALPGGIGWYRKKFVTEKNFQNHLITILFDGVYKT